MGSADSYIIDLAKSFRHILGNEAPDEQGLACIWHQGKSGAELLSWQSADGTIARQELTFFGKVVIFGADGIHTASVPAAVTSSHAGLAKSSVVNIDPERNPKTLQAATTLLANIPKPDDYTAHLHTQLASLTG